MVIWGAQIGLIIRICVKCLNRHRESNLGRKYVKQVFDITGNNGKTGTQFVTNQYNRTRTEVVLQVFYLEL